MKRFAVLLLALSACVVVPTAVIGGPQPIAFSATMRSTYDGWAKDIETCSKQKVPATSWRVVQGETFSSPVFPDLKLYGLYDSATNTITLASDDLWNPWVVRHEMLHAALWRGLWLTGHPPTFFLGVCGGLVTSP